MTSRLSLLIAAHDAALAAYDECTDADHDFTGKAVDAIRDAILNHRPRLDEVATKAAFMASRKTFTEWDNFDQAKLITALTPLSPHPQRMTGGDRNG